MFIPVVEILLSTLDCSGSSATLPDAFMGSFGFTCFAGSHVALATVSTVIAAAYTAFAAVYALVYVDSHPLSSSLKGVSTGRPAFFMILMKVRGGRGGAHRARAGLHAIDPLRQCVLVVLTTVISPTLGGQAVSAICNAAGVLWLANILWCVGRQGRQACDSPGASSTAAVSGSCPRRCTR